MLWLAGCNAPRDNPYDPDADNYVGPGASSISGRVTTYAGEELAGAEIMANPLSPGAVRGSYSNSAGYYTITEVLPGSYQLLCSLNGYASDTMEISVPEKAFLTGKNFALNGFPIIHDFQVTSHYINASVLPFLYYQIRGQATLTLPDDINDMAGVFLQTQLGLQWAMNFDVQSGDSFHYSISLNESSLPGGSVDSIEGHYFICSVLDTSGIAIQSEPATIRRYLINPPYTLSPGYNVLIYETNPWLTWDPYTAPFYFEYTARVYNTDGLSPVLYRQQSDVSATEDSVQTGFLPSGEYIWTLEVIDEYGNSALSLDAKFQVF
ncbi:MAG TPA: carboxypeptidase-like regulatory domain-containing protein [bacterium]